MTYAFRTEPCPAEDCDNGKQISTDSLGFRAVRCETCEGDGTIDAGCAGCGTVCPLDEEGWCEDCTALTECHGDPFWEKAA